ncbi:hypothetical protein NRIC_30220 [Enterococcus florum]|uniref:Polysaccharide biosynthesis protein C-terminal domain-containing protein n=1 Tax=Enterococcus florum TaxID=2480627 RepID=A0A4P5PFG4_9ENTE|nr:MATE family efflux transporter [Enterococcus florum]GCF95131.1 hypothetical protein NRIC_30220 [Enterococcus florum]
MYKNLTIKNISSSFGLQIINTVSGLILSGLIINFYGSNINGTIISITSLLNYITVLDSGLTGVIKFELYEPLSKNNWTKISSILASARIFFKRIAITFLGYIFLLLVLYTKVLESTISKSSINLLIIAISLILFFEYYSGISNRLLILADNKHVFYYTLQSVVTIINLFLSIILIHFKQSIILVKFVNSSIFLINPLCLFFYVKIKYKIDYDIQPEENAFIQRWDGLAHHIANLSRNNIDILLMTIFFSPREISIYSVYMMILNGIGRFSRILTTGMDSIIGKMLALKEYDLLKNYFDRAQFLFALVVYIFITTISEVIIPFLNIYINDGKNQGYLNADFMILIVLCQLIVLLRTPYNHVVFSAGKYKETRGIALTEVALNTILSFLFIAIFGINGLVLGTLLSSLYYLIRVELFIKTSSLANIISVNVKQQVIFTIFGVLIYLVSQVDLIKISNWSDFIIVGSIVFVKNCFLFLLIGVVFFPKQRKIWLNFFLKR